MPTIIKSDNGFPRSWKAGRLEYLVKHIIETKLQKLSVDRVMLINTTWLLDRDIAAEIQQADPDFIVCHNFVDPIIPEIHNTIINTGVPCVFLGNNSQCRIDFWAMAIDLNFFTYNDLELNNDAKKFICLNRKPHVHRKILVNKLQEFEQLGYISLANQTVDTEFSSAQGIFDTASDEFAVKNDIYSLGDLSVWKNSYLCLVTETVFSTPSVEDFFISEKTWKPILGQRPFFVYGQPGLRQYLQQQGFDIFNDLIDYDSLDHCSREIDYAELAIQTIHKISDPWQEYQQILPRLNKNQQNFHSYVYKQWDNLLQLDFNLYL
jgi:hypothetical protein